MSTSQQSEPFSGRDAGSGSLDQDRDLVLDEDISCLQGQEILDLVTSQNSLDDGGVRLISLKSE